jgi:hypothetical protein
MWFSYDFGTSTVAVKSLLWLGVPGDFQILAPVYSLFYQDSEKLMKVVRPWYSTGSSWPDLPNGRKISGWLHRFPGKLAVHPGVGVAQLTIRKFLENPPSSWAARHPPAFEQLEYCWPWNIVGRHIDPILFGQLRLTVVEKAHNNGCWPCATW